MNFTNQTEYEESSGLQFFLNNLGDYLAYTIITSLGAICGVIGNLLIIVAICFNRDLKTKSNVIIFNLAVSDLLISCFVDVFNVIGAILGKEFFQDKIWLCDLIAFFVMILCMSSLSSMGLIAFNRYIFICHKEYYKRIFSKFKTIVYCVFTWSVGLITEIVAIILIGWDANFYDPKTLGCTWNRVINKTYTLTLMTISIVIPCVFISFFYLKIYIYAMSAKRRALRYSSRENKLIKESFRIAKGLFGSFLVFTICWLPYALNIILDLDDRANRAAYVWTIQLAMINSCLNPVIYGLTNSKFNKGFQRILQCILIRKSTPRTTTTTKSFSDNNTDKL